MAATLRHRGPDHTGFHRELGIILGNNRLAIIDLAGGNQPIYNETGELAVVFNGEIYNYRELRRELEAKGHAFRTKSDTEVIVHAFEAFGADCVDRLNGMFAFAIWNSADKTLFLARDRLGIKPLYFLQTDDAFAFASEPKALFALQGGRPRPDWTAINRFFTFGYFPLTDCGFKGIRKFPAGHVATLKDRRLDVARFWRPAYKAKESISFEAAAGRLMELAEGVVSKELEADVPVGVFLSGGLDSALVAHCAGRITGGAVPTFTLGFEEDTHDESAHARAIAGHLGLRHFAYRASREELRASLDRVGDKMDEPFGDATMLPLLILSEFVRKHVKVALTGWGGDELFAGYPTYRAHRLAALYRRLPAAIGRRLIPALVNRLPVSEKYLSFEFKAKRFVQGMDLSPELQHFVWMGYFDDDAKRSLFKPTTREQMGEGTFAPLADVIAGLEETDVVDRIQHLDALTFLEGNGLYQADRISMAASLEARVPLLNRDMVDFASALPADVKMRGGILKAVVKEALRPHLPAAILELPKKGFGPPAAAWLRGLFQETAARRLSQERIEGAGVFEYGSIRRLLDEHNTKKKDHGRSLWLLLSFQLWHDKYFFN
jgi:asparagine synthase (glutamine-hydrolysing)